VRYFRIALDASLEEVRVMLEKYPTVLNLSVQRNLGPKVAVFMEGMGGDKAEVRAALVATPQMLGYRWVCALWWRWPVARASPADCACVCEHARQRPGVLTGCNRSQRTQRSQSCAC
jgi:hypothetical protein